MDNDDFCDSFECVILMEFQEQCFTYNKGPFDIECHLFCQLPNCTKEPIAEIYCPKYECWPITTSTTTPSTTTPSTTTTRPSPIPDSQTGIIVGSVVVSAIICGLILLGIFFLLKWRRHNLGVSQQNLTDAENNTDHHFVVATPTSSESSDEDFETRPLQYFIRDQNLEDEADNIINRQAGASSLLASTVSQTNTNVIKNVELKSFTTFKREAVGIQTTVF